MLSTSAAVKIYCLSATHLIAQGNANSQDTPQQAMGDDACHMSFLLYSFVSMIPHHVNYPEDIPEKKCAFLRTFREL